MTVKYMHTIDGMPAAFDGDQICYRSFYGKAQPLCDDLAQIKREQQLTKKYRDSMGFSDYETKYSHLRILV